MKVALLLSAALLAASAPASTAQGPASTETIARVDALFSGIAADAPGCAVGIAQKGKPILERAYGLANLEFDIPNTAATVFESGSVAKQFTAAAILLLEQDGRLKLGDDIRKYLPEMPDYGDVITIEMLLNHTSGLRDWGSVAAAGGKPRGERTFSNTEVLDIASRQKSLNYKPGAEYSYTNTGYNLAATIVERVSGKSFQEFSKERMFTPLGMTHSQWRDDFDRIVKGRAVAYARSGGGFRQSMPFMNVYGNGGLLTTIGDFLIWNEALAQNRLGVAVTSGLETKGKLGDGREIPYARGLTVQNYRGVSEISHSGATGGYTTWLGRYPEQALSIALLCNVSDAMPSPRRLADVFLPAASSAPPAAKPVFADPAAHAGLYVNRNTGYPLQLVAGGGGLMVGPSAGRPPLVLSRLSETGWTGGGNRFSFGGTDSFGMETGDGNLFDYVRTAAVKPTPEHLAEYAGGYASDETRATYRIGVDGGQLVLRIDGWPDTAMKLSPSYKDAFMSGPVLIRFHRDNAGRITQLSWGDSRMRDLRAARLK